jgi:hypothetical protein
VTNFLGIVCFMMIWWKFPFFFIISYTERGGRFFFRYYLSISIVVRHLIIKIFVATNRIILTEKNVYVLLFNLLLLIMFKLCHVWKFFILRKLKCFVSSVYPLTSKKGYPFIFFCQHCIANSSVNVTHIILEMD